MGRMALKNNKAPLLCYFNFCASFRSHWWIQNGVTVRERLIWVKIDDFFRRVNLQFDGWPRKKNRAPLLCHFKLCASFSSHWWIQTGVTVRKRPIWVKFDDFQSRVALKFDGWALKNNRAPLTSNIKLCASFHHHMWIQTGVTVRKRLSWVVTPVTLTFDLWPWPFAWTLLRSLVRTPENSIMIRWREHSQKGVTDGRTDRQTDGRTDRRTEPFIELLGRSLKCNLCYWYRDEMKFSRLLGGGGGGGGGVVSDLPYSTMRPIS